MILNGEQIAKLLEQNLANYAVKNSDPIETKRKFKETSDKLRPPFAVDIDRIVYLKANNRLVGKTQVVTPRSSDHAENRFTHEEKVVRIARQMARSLQLNEDLVEAISKGHDLGHPPFGHGGEAALNECMQKFDLSFEHNEHSLRIVTKLPNIYHDFRGINPTHALVEGLQKHRTEYDQPEKNYKGLSLEAQIVNLADQIAYNAHDLENGLNSKILKLSQVQNLEIVKQAHEMLEERKDPTKSPQRYASMITKIMVQSAMHQLAQNLQKNKIETLKDVYQTKEDLIQFDPETEEKVSKLRNTLLNNYYLSPSVQNQVKIGQNIIKKLFDFYMMHPDQMPDDRQANQIADEPKRAIIVKDYIAGMTDNFAKEQFQKHALS